MLIGSRRDRMVLRREPVARPSDGTPTTFVCPACDVVLCDGIAYTWCPACNLPVDWVDLTLPVWCCPTCDAMVNERRQETPGCKACARAMVRIDRLERPPVPGDEEPTPPSQLGALLRTLLEKLSMGLVLMGVVGPLLSLSLDPQWRMFALALATPVFLVPVTLAGVFLWSLGSSLTELRELMRDRKTRIIHGLEHATARLLEAEQHVVHGGLTHDGFFELHLRNEGRAEKQAKEVRKAVNAAIARIHEGERALAYHPRCGTSLLVTVALVATMAMTSAVLGFFVNLRPEALLVIGISYLSVLLLAARPLGLLAQRFLTVSTSFQSARILRIARTLTHGGERVCFDVHLYVRE